MRAREDPGASLPESPEALALELVARFGGHPAGTLGLDLEAADESNLGRWLVATCLLATRCREELALAAFRALERAGLSHPQALATSDLLAVAALLTDAELPRAEVAAQRLLRLSRALASESAGSLSALANRCVDLEDLASRLWRLAPGFGRAAVHRFLQPLRQVWPAAADLPLDPAARAAAVHLGLIAPDQDEVLGPGALLAVLRESGAPPLRDVEAALSRLGRRACLRERASRCPLGAQCPVARSRPHREAGGGAQGRRRRGSGPSLIAAGGGAKLFSRGVLGIALLLLAPGCSDPIHSGAGQPRESGVEMSKAGSSGADPTAASERLRLEMVQSQIAARGVSDGRVLAAMRKVPRHEFVPAGVQDHAYEDRPLPIGFSQTISQPYIVAAMTELAELREGSRVLEIGTGSGYQAAVIHEIVGEVYSIEIIPELATRAQETLARLGYESAHIRQGDGYLGWPEKAPFDAILVTAAPPEVPRALLDQLAVGGRLVVPVGQFYQQLERHTRTPEGIEKEVIFGVRFVPMVHGK